MAPEGTVDTYWTCLTLGKVLVGSADTSFLVRILGPTRKGLWLGRRHCALVQGGVRIGPGKRRETVSLSPKGDKGIS